MKVAFLSYGFGKEVSSSGKYGFYLVNELRKLGVCVDVFGANFIVKTFGAPVFYLRNSLLRLNDYDVVHSNEGSGVFLYHPCMIDTWHHDYKQSYDVNSMTFHNLEMLQGHKVRRIIVPSYATKSAVLRYGFSEDKISVVYHGIDHTVFKRKSSLLLRKNYGLLNCFVAISVGKLIKRKRQIDIVNALAGIPNAVLILVGKGEEESAIKKMATEKQVKIIHFRHVPESFLVDLYNASDVYVHTSILEGFGLTILEAMACGLPVISYEAGDFTRIIREAGVLLKTGDVVGVRNALLYLKENRAKREELSLIAQENSAQYTWEKTAREHLNVYLSAINKSQNREILVSSICFRGHRCVN